MLFGLWVAKNDNQVRGVMVAGSTALLAGAIWLTIYFVQQRAAGNTDTMLLANSMTVSYTHLTLPTTERV